MPDDDKSSSCTPPGGWELNHPTIDQQSDKQEEQDPTMGRRMLRKRKVEQREEISRKQGTDFHQTEEKYAQEIETRQKKIILDK